MNKLFERARGAFEHKGHHSVIRGELWIGKEPFQAARLDDSLEGHIRLRRMLEMDILFLPVSASDLPPSNMDYRRFSLKQVEEAVAISDLFVGIIVDGPFQRLVEKNGLWPLLTEFVNNEPVISRRFRQEAAAMKDIIEICLKLNVGAVVIADDLAYQQSTYLNPDILRRLLFPLYAEATKQIHSGNAYALLHSCGNITALVPQLVSCAFDGLAACQNQCLDLISLKKEYGSRLTILAGIDADLLDAGTLSESQKIEFSRRVETLAQGGGFVLSSSCGLYSSHALERLKELYGIADESLTHLCPAKLYPDKISHL